MPWALGAVCALQCFALSIVAVLFLMRPMVQTGEFGGIAALGTAALVAFVTSALASAFVVRWTLRRSRTGRGRLPRRLLWSAVASVAVYTWPLLVHGLLGGQPLRKILGLTPSQ